MFKDKQGINKFREIFDKKREWFYLGRAASLYGLTLCEKLERNVEN